MEAGEEQPLLVDGCPVLGLPSEMVVTIFSHMEHEDLLCAARVCRRWKKLSEEGALWKERAKRLQRRKMLNTLSTGLTDITISMWGGRNLVLRLCDTSGAMEDKVREGEWPWGFANVDLFLCCFDVTSLASLQHVKTKWAPLVRKLCLDAPIILCGLKGEYRYLIEGDQDDEHAFRSDWAIPEEECERVKEEIGAQSYIDFSPLLGDGLTLGTLFSCLSIVVGVVDSEEEDQERANDEPSEPEDDNEIDILADLLARQGNRRATADSDEEYEGW
ncbi:Fbox domain containing protein [Acanthamoeba castellanii str. Neff]|uniref:Fbox domain containing protein n=1 Tax=Acanthamoeba castellanii (strain ATCC 30010 / Neff) TaxID=1257118 RepID=L8H5T0_ACACF|nr:Fbox domain containing protein [Acanthamoeba castellanii str. Neff]ELR20879.1 Fbox domain containing protein [Acanthamoeba castellanii str. Neff]